MSRPLLGKIKVTFFCVFFLPPCVYGCTCVCSSGSWLAGCSGVMFGRVPVQQQGWRTGGDVPELCGSRNDRQRDGEWRGLSLDRSAVDTLPSPSTPTLSSTDTALHFSLLPRCNVMARFSRSVMFSSLQVQSRWLLNRLIQFTGIGMQKMIVFIID